MNFELLPALLAGLTGTVVMSAMMALATAGGMTRMPPMPLVVGSMLSGDPRTAKRIGVVIHFVLMGTLVFGIAYAALFAGLESATVSTGALIGLAHGVVVGAVAMPMMPAVHPRMTASSVAGQAAVDTSSGTVTLSAPGMFGSNWGAMTPVGLIAGHVVYGVVVALVYSNLA
jgi:uncharacterized membrane protein YagU involved in acid resistance